MSKFRCGDCNKLYNYPDIDYEDNWFELLRQKGWSYKFKEEDEGYGICPKCTEGKKEKNDLENSNKKITEFIK